MADVSRETELPAEWLDSLERSKAQIADGHAIPLQPVLDRLRASADRLEAESRLDPAETGSHPVR